MKWTQKDIDYLTSNYKSSGDPQKIAIKLGRTTTAIYSKARKLGLILSSGLYSTSHYVESLRDKGITFNVLEDYKGAQVIIKHSCDKNHEWSAAPNNILRYSGCPYCSKHGLNAGMPGVLYYIKITCVDGQIFYKIGITTTSIARRFSSDSDKIIESIILEEFQDMTVAKVKEKDLLHKYRDYKCNKSILKSGGNTELFTKDVLQLF